METSSSAPQDGASKSLVILRRVEEYLSTRYRNAGHPHGLRRGFLRPGRGCGVLVRIRLPFAVVTQLAHLCGAKVFNVNMEYFRTIGRRGCAARKGTEKGKKSAKLAATHRWLLEEYLRQDDLREKLVSLLSENYKSLSGKEMLRCLASTLQQNAGQVEKIKERRIAARSKFSKRLIKL